MRTSSSPRAKRISVTNVNNAESLTMPMGAVGKGTGEVGAGPATPDDGGEGVVGVDEQATPVSVPSPSTTTTYRRPLIIRRIYSDARSRFVFHAAHSLITSPSVTITCCVPVAGSCYRKTPRASGDVSYFAAQPEPRAAPHVD